MQKFVMTKTREEVSWQSITGNRLLWDASIKAPRLHAPKEGTETDRDDQEGQ